MEAGDVGCNNTPPPVGSDPTLSSVPSSGDSETDFGPWLLVSRRRGFSRPRGGGARSATTAPGSAAASPPEGQAVRGVSAQRTRGGLRGGASGRLPVSHATLHLSPGAESAFTDTISDPPGSPLYLLAVTGESTLKSSNIFREPKSSLPNKSSHSDLSPVPYMNKPSSTPTRHPPLSGIGPLIQRSHSPLPVLVQSITGDHPSNSLSLSQEHSRLVAQVSEALEDGTMEEDSDQDEGDSVESDDQMSEEDDTDDLMTLDQMQEEARREALIRKGSLLAVETQKKGRVEKGDPVLP